MANLNTFHEMFFGILSKEYCNIFYGLMLFMFLFVFFGVISLVIYVLTSKNVELPIVILGVVELLVISISYMQQRMLYSMCLKM